MKYYHADWVADFSSPDFGSEESGDCGSARRAYRGRWTLQQVAVQTTLLAALVVVVGCSDEPECLIDSDCFGVCVNNMCVLDEDTGVRRDGGFGDVAVQDAAVADAITHDAPVDAGERVRMTEWTETFGSTGPSAGQEQGRAITHTSTGDIVVTGPFRGSLTVGSTTLVSEGEGDAFVVRLTPTGELVWAMSFGSSANDTCRGVAVDAEDNIYLAGQHSGPVSGAVTLTHTDAQDAFVVKLSSEGVPQWAQAYGRGGLDTANTISVVEDHVFVAGAFSGDISFGAERFGVDERRGGFLIDLNRDGELQWSQVFQTDAANVQALGTAVIDNEKVYVSGIFGGPVDFGGTVGVRAPLGPQDAFVLKVNGAGESTQFAQFGGDDVVLGRALAAAPGRGAVLVGRFLGTANFGGSDRTSAGGQDSFVVRLGPDLTPLWDAVLGGAGADRALGVATQGESVVVAGQFHQTMDLGTTTLTSAGDSDAFAVEFDALGQVVWAERLGGSEDAWAYAASLDADHLVVTGYFTGATDFGDAETEGDIFIRSTSR